MATTAQQAAKPTTLQQGAKPIGARPQPVRRGELSPTGAISYDVIPQLSTLQQGAKPMVPNQDASVIPVPQFVKPINQQLRR